MLKHWAVSFAQDVNAQFNGQVWTNPEHVAIKGRVMKFAKGKSVRNNGLAQRMTIRKDVCRFQELFVTQSADCAAFLIGAQDSLSEALLM